MQRIQASVSKFEEAKSEVAKGTRVWPQPNNLQFNIDPMLVGNYYILNDFN
jgi:hypothetical protein